MSGLMQDKVGIVTAGGSGIGRASALAFAEEGAKVVVSDISEEAGQESRMRTVVGQGTTVVGLVSPKRKD